MSNRFNFTEITLKSKADITEVMNNFNKIENEGAIIDDLPIVTSIILSTTDWIEVDNYYQYTIKNTLIKEEPYIIDIIFNDLTAIKSPIYPKSNSQAVGSVILITKVKPLNDLTAKLIVTRGIW